MSVRINREADELEQQKKAKVNNKLRVFWASVELATPATDAIY